MQDNVAITIIKNYTEKEEIKRKKDCVRYAYRSFIRRYFMNRINILNETTLSLRIGHKMLTNFIERRINEHDTQTPKKKNEFHY